MAQTDREALVALYHATDGPNWKYNTNWGSGAPVREWYGVEANDQGRVVKLSLSSNTLRGHIPPELGALSELQKLLLYNNELTGPIPPEIGNLAALQLLNLRCNMLSGHIPRQLGDLSALQHLYLSHNKLDGPIPPELGKLAALESLELSSNQLSGHIPRQLGALSALQHLYLSHNKLDGHIPRQLGDLSALLYLQLSENKLNGPIPPELGNLAALKVLSLRGNQLTGHIPRQLGDLSALQHLFLSKNKLNGSIPKELGDLRELRTLWLNDNRLTGPIPEELGKLTAFTKLYLNNNKLSGPIPPELGKLAALETLNLQWNQLSGAIPAQLGALNKLAWLGLSDNQLSGHIPPELGDLSKLETLRLGSNELTGPLPPELAKVTTLQEIDVGNNQLSGPLPLSDSRQELLRWIQRVNGEIEDVEHAHAVRAVNVLTSLWHFCLPVLDDATDLWLLLETFGGSHRGLWWACLCVFVLADIERVYTAFFFVALSLSVMLYMGTCGCVDLSGCMSFLGGHKLYVEEPLHLLLDSLLWTLFGSRARSSPFMHAFGLAGESSGRALQEAGLGLHAIDVMVFFHPFRYFGEFVMSFPRGHRRAEVAERNEAHRRKISMVRAVGETLCVDPLFLALSVVTGGWDDNFAGLSLLSALFSVLELVTELQYYVTEADAGNSLSNAAVRDVEVGVGASENPDSRPIELVGPYR